MADPRIGPLAVALRTARERAGLSQRELARQAEWNFSLVSRLERGDRVHLPAEKDLRRLDDASGAGGQLLRVAGYDGPLETADQISDLGIQGWTRRPEISEALRNVIEKHIAAMVQDIRKTLGQ